MYKDQDHLHVRPSYVCQIVQDGCMDQVFHDVGVTCQVNMTPLERINAWTEYS